MKKISVISVLAALVLPAFANETVVPVEEKVVSEIAAVEQSEKTISQQNESAVVDQVAQQYEEPKFEKQEKASNPKTRFPRGMQLGLGVSPTSGLNAFIGYNNKNFDSFWAKRFGVRFDFATYSPIKNKLNSRINSYIGDEGVEIEDTLKLDNVYINAKHVGAMVDFYPFGNTWFLGGWRVSGGYMSGNLDVNADIHGTKELGRIEFELGDRKYSYSGDEMHGKAILNWKYSGPYVGTGFDLGLFWGIKIYMDAGVVFADNHAKIDLNVPLDGLQDITNDVPQNVVDFEDLKTQFEQAKTKELSDAQKELDKVDYYPLVKLGFMYRF